MTRRLDYRPNREPTSHQVRGVNRIVTGTSLNFDDQGLGKTKQAYDSAGQLLASNEVNLCIFVTKAALIHTLCNEIEIDAIQLSPILVTGSKRERILIYKYLTANCLVLSYETLVGDIQIIEKVISQNNVAIFFDESHYLKNEKAKRTVAALLISRLAKRCICFSGTPAPNGYADLFTQLTVAGYDVGADRKDFKNRFGTEEDLAAAIQGKFVRRRKESVRELGIPEKTIIKVKVDTAPVQNTIYAGILGDAIHTLEKQRLSRKILPIENVLVQMMRLNQVASNPALIFDGYTEIPGKFRTLRKLVLEIVRRDEKVVIWTSFKSNLPYLFRLFKDFEVLELSGNVSGKKKFEIASKFQTEDKFKILVGVPAAAREGFTLTSANNAIFLDRSFSNLDWLQAQDRIHRIGQKRCCNVYALIANSTIDEQIDVSLENKEQGQIRLLSDSHRSKVVKVEMIEELISSLRNQLT